MKRKMKKRAGREAKLVFEMANGTCLLMEFS
jgi:hypothetical protein